MPEKKLNIDIADSVYRFESLMERILPKRIFYKLLLRGKGLEFDGYRRFDFDDDAGYIDWKASKRANTLLVKQYVEERDIKIMFLIDVSDNMIFGSQKKLKCEYAAELVAALSYVITHNPLDQIGCLFFNNDIVHFIPLKGGKKQFETIVYEISNPDLYGGFPDINNSLRKSINFLRPDLTLLFIISDFIGMDEKSEKNFEDLGAMFETISIIIKDPLDKTLPNINKEVVIENPKTGERILINPKIAKRIYERNSLIQEKTVEKIFEESRIDYLHLSTEEDFSPKLAMFLKKRVEKRE